MDLDVNLELDKDLRETQRRPHCQDELRGEADCSLALQSRAAAALSHYS